MLRSVQFAKVLCANCLYYITEWARPGAKTLFQTNGWKLQLLLITAKTLLHMIWSLQGW